MTERSRVDRISEMTANTAFIFYVVFVKCNIPEINVYLNFEIENFIDCEQRLKAIKSASPANLGQIAKIVCNAWNTRKSRIK